MTSLPFRQKLKFNSPPLLLLLLAAALLVSHLGASRDFVRAESYFALGSRLMVMEGNWLAPHAPDEPVLNKPPLQYWLTGIAYSLFGAGYGAARLPSALAGLLALVLLFLLAKEKFDRQTAMLCVGILTTSYLFYTFARTAMSDMLLTLFVSGALHCFILSLTEGERQRSLALTFLGYACVALGMLTKGLVAVLLVAGPLMLELIYTRDISMLKRLRIFSGALIIICIAAPYFLLLYLKLGPDPLRAFFIGENLRRFTGEIYAYASRPIWYLPLAFFSDFAPWSLLLLPAIYFLLRDRQFEPQQRRTLRLLFFWLLFPLIFFSFSHFKLDYYLLPAMPAAALITGIFAARTSKLPPWARAYIYSFTILFALLMVVMSFISIRFLAQLSVETRYGWLLLALCLASFIFILFSLGKRWLRLSVWTLVFSIWLALLLHESLLVPALSHYQPVERLAQSVPTGGARVYTSSLASDWANTLAFHLPAGVQVTRLSTDRDGNRLREILLSEPYAVLLVKDEEARRTAENGVPFRVLAEGETFGHGDLTLRSLRHPVQGRLLLISGRGPGQGP